MRLLIFFSLVKRKYLWWHEMGNFFTLHKVAVILQWYRVLFHRWWSWVPLWKRTTLTPAIWFNTNNVIMYNNDNNLLYSDDAARKRFFLCLFCNAQNFSLRKLWKKVVLVNKTFFGHVLSLPSIMFSWHAEMNYIDRKKLHFEEEKIE